MAVFDPETGPDELTAGPSRPRDLALLLLATSYEPPRARARDQQADRAGGALRREVLDRLIRVDPEPEALDGALAAIVDELGEPTGPTRGICSMILQEWAESRLVPGYWGWLISEAVSQGEGDRRGPRRRRPDGPESAP